MLETTIFLIFGGLLIFIILLIVLYALFANRGRSTKPRLYSADVPKEYLELDLRLPYKRFKELYPWTKITYRDYKKLQMEKAFRRAVSSQENKRMVR